MHPLARNKTGFQGNGLGIAQPGETIVFVLGPHKEDTGGGTFGEAMKTFMELPHINGVAYPFHNEDHKGYWYLYEIAVGTHPKAFRNPAGLEEGTAIPERQRSGVVHWGVGITVHHDPGVMTQSKQLKDFTEKYNLPRDHGFHTHTYFSNYEVHLRNADR